MRGGQHLAADADRPAVKKKVAPGVESPVKIKSGASVKDLGEALEIGAGELIMTMMKLGEMVTITQSLSDEAIEILAAEFERQVISSTPRRRRATSLRRRPRRSEGPRSGRDHHGPRRPR